MIVIYDILYCTVIAQPRRPTAEVRSTVIVAVAVSVPTTFTDCRPRIPSYTTVTSAIGVFFCSKRNYAHPTTNPNEKKISRSVFLNLGPRVLRSHLGFRYYSFFVLLVSSPMEILLQGRKHLFDSLIIPHVHIYNWHPWLIFGIRCLKAYVMKYFPGNIP